MDSNDRAKTGCLGILLPLALGVFGVHRVLHPPHVDYLFHRPVDPSTRIPVGIFALGLALILHGMGFVPYQRIPGLRYVIAALGVAIFVYGLVWHH
jgi:hypothetical protein